MIEKYIKYISGLELWKKISFAVVSFLASILLALLLSVYMGVNLIVYTSSFIRVFLFLIIKKIAGFLFLNKLFYKLAERYDS
ncbi:MAG: hypothetical protein ACOCQ1_04695 [Halanaerobiaceae bacterium]